MQNKPNFHDAQMNVSNIITSNYKIFIPLAGQKNKPNSNPISNGLSKGYYFFVRVQRIQSFIIRRLPIRGSLHVFTGYPFIILKEKLQLYFAQSQGVCNYRQ